MKKYLILLSALIISSTLIGCSAANEKKTTETNKSFENVVLLLNDSEIIGSWIEEDTKNNSGSLGSIIKVLRKTDE